MNQRDEYRKKSKRRLVRNLILLGMIIILWLLGVLYVLWYPKDLFAGGDRIKICQLTEENKSEILLEKLP